ncbi:c-type cytochrome [Oricola cellulosilytica]|uniref:Cytochrome C n=1 Tax=Oricola cellulosilytica TaxID=1429082 RepID=A0A4R0P7X5_9HYPH|nr:c-type cytochrome [Oricola cellulosilytica]TCD11979.1 cytochrome C [Oricola cellulosilytica]
MRFGLLATVLLLSVATQATANDVAWPERLVGHGGPVKAVAVASDGSTALTASFDYSVIYWKLDGASGQVAARLIGHNAGVNDVAFVTGQEKAVSVADDGALAIWNLKDGTLDALLEDTGDKVIDVAVDEAGRYAAAARWDGTARIYDIAAMRETGRAEGHDGNVNAVAFSLDGASLFTASYDGTIRSWPIADGRITGEARVLHSNGWGVNVLAPLPGASLLAFGSLDGMVGVIELQSGRMSELKKAEHPILSLDVSKRAGLLAAGTANGEIFVFDIETGTMVEDYHDSYGPIWGLSFVPEGDRLYRAGLDDFAIGWQVAPREQFEKNQSEYPRRFEARDVSDPGEAEFLRKCSVCHTLTPEDQNRAGPTLYGLFGRRAGTVEGYAYSEALVRSDIVWDADTVSQLFDDGPDVVTPGTKMPVQRLKSVERRDALVRYLRDATRPKSTIPPPGERG